MNPASFRAGFHAFCLALLSAVPAAALADDLPKFRQGLWEFKRSVDGGDGQPAKLTNQKCTSPTDDMNKKTESMAQAGCQASPVTRSGNLYSFSLQCSIQGVEIESKSVITVASDSAYTVDVESKQGDKATREHLIARRLGDCEAG
jgi:Protein of unknown function (DUF3617)